MQSLIVIVIVAATAMAAAPAALVQVGATHNSASEFEVLVACDPMDTLIVLTESDEPHRIALRSTDAKIDEVSFSLRVLRTTHWSTQDGARGDAHVVLADHGDGMATVTVDRSAAGERLVEITASGARGESQAVHLLRILPADPPERDEGAHGPAPGLDVMVGGALTSGNLDFAESPGIACVELNASDAAGDKVAFSLRVLDTVPLDPLAGTGASPVLVDHGDGTAMVMADKSSAGERTVEIAASSMHGREQDTYALRILSTDADRRPQPHAGGLPHAVEGKSMTGARLPPRLVAQAHMPMCANAPYGEMSGVPPIEGTSNHNNSMLYRPDITPLGVKWHRWECQTSASFGTQVAQRINLCDVPGDDRVHYYIKNNVPRDKASPSWLINPYTENIADYNRGSGHTYAAAPEPQWVRDLQDDPNRKESGLPEPSRPYTHAAFTELQVFLNPTAYVYTILETRVIGTHSSVPELLPFSDKMVIRATAFHADDVSFQIKADMSVIALEASHALVNGILVPASFKPKGFNSFDTTLSVHVKVSDIARHSDIFIRGINDDKLTDDGVVKDLHEVTLVAEIPVLVQHKNEFEAIKPERAVEPWGCWPRLHDEAWVP